MGAWAKRLHFCWQMSVSRYGIHVNRPHAETECTCTLRKRGPFTKETLLLTRTNFHPRMDTWSQASKTLKLQWLHRLRLGMDKWFHSTFKDGCEHLSMLAIKWIHISKTGQRWMTSVYCNTALTSDLDVFIFKESNLHVPYNGRYAWRKYKLSVSTWSCTGHIGGMPISQLLTTRQRPAMFKDDLPLYTLMILYIW